MYEQDLNASPINPIPTIVIIFVIAIWGPEVVFQLAERGFMSDPQAIGWRQEMAQRFAFSDRVFDWMRANNTFPAEHLLRFFSYPFIQPNLFEFAFSSVILLTMGKYLAENAHWSLVPICFFAAAIGSTIVTGLLVEEAGAMIGARNAAFGVLSGYAAIVLEEDVFAGRPARRAKTMILFIVILQVAFFAMDTSSHTWIERFSAFIIGGLAAFVFAPNAKRRAIWLREKIRRN